MQRERTNVHFRIPREPVVSSNIAAIGYCGETQELDIEFKDGSAWRYFSVKHAVYLGLRESSSVGKYFIRHIRGSYGGTPLDRVTGEPKQPQPGPNGQPVPVREREPGP